MSTWKVLFIAVFGFVCLALGLSAIVVPLAADEHRWLWFAGLLVATVFMGTLFTLFLKRVDRTF